MSATIRGTVAGMARSANPAFAAGAVLVPVAALTAAATAGGHEVLTYVHVMAGVLWTGIDLFMASVLGPVLGGLAVERRADVFRRLTPKMTFLMPTLALVTVAGGILLALRLSVFPNAGPWIALFSTAAVLPALLGLGWRLDAFGDRRWQAAFVLVLVAHVGYLAAELPAFAATSPALAAALGIVVVLTVVGFGLLLPGEVRIYLEMTSPDPDDDLIGRVGMRNAKLAGVQGLFQLAIVAVMVSIRWGGF
jgi:hypothetical protein